MAKDIRGQIELRETIDAVMKFGRIMSQAALFDDDDERAEVDNPLLKNVTELKQDYLEDYRKISRQNRFFKHISENFIKETIAAFKEDAGYKPLDDETIQGVRHEIKKYIIEDRADVRQLTQDMGEAFKLTQTAAKSENKGANQVVYINLIIQKIQDKAQRVFDLEVLFLELDVSFKPIEEDILKRMIGSEESPPQEFKKPKIKEELGEER